LDINTQNNIEIGCNKTLAGYIDLEYKIRELLKKHGTYKKLDFFDSTKFMK